jgi:hypothetical protein
MEISPPNALRSPSFHLFPNKPLGISPLPARWRAAGLRLAERNGGGVRREDSHGAVTRGWKRKGEGRQIRGGEGRCLGCGGPAEWGEREVLRAASSCRNSRVLPPCIGRGGVGLVPPATSSTDCTWALAARATGPPCCIGRVSQRCLCLL